MRWRHRVSGSRRGLRSNTALSVTHLAIHSHLFVFEFFLSPFLLCRWLKLVFPNQRACVIWLTGACAARRSSASGQATLTRNELIAIFEPCARDSDKNTEDFARGQEFEHTTRQHCRNSPVALLLIERQRRGHRQRVRRANKHTGPRRGTWRLRQRSKQLRVLKVFQAQTTKFEQSRQQVVVGIQFENGNLNIIDNRHK